MKCVSCTAEIPPAFVHAIQSNVCPGCAGPIMTEDSKKLMDELKAQLIEMPNDPEGLAGWILSTYDIFPKGTVQATPFHRKSKKRVVEMDDEYEEGDDPITVDAEGRPIKYAKTASHQHMLKQTGVDKLMKDPKRAALMRHLRETNGADEAYGDEFEQEQDEDDGITVDEEEDDLGDPEMLQIIAKARAAKSSKTGKRSSKRKKTAAATLANMANFSMPGVNGEMSQYELNQLQNFVGGPSSDDPDMDGFDNLPPALQADRLARLQKQRELSYGGSIGAIKRHG